MRDPQNLALRNRFSAERLFLSRIKVGRITRQEGPLAASVIRVLLRAILFKMIQQSGPKTLDQTALIEFLSADLDLAFTLLETAEVTSSAERTTIIVGVRRSLELVRRLGCRIRDHAVSAAVHNRADELEAALECWKRP